ncbi:tigger transposable element-derived protein 1-like [Macrobrachium nipponense]|uniref:tigger transposable element-derived protein 1-like n=1 Tax=Macrobrachium nipponense TaxID=159736 RepID=UPI0030C8891F
MTVNEKVKLLDMLKAGSSYASVARMYGLNESTVRYIKKDELKIRKTASITFSKDTKRVVTPRNKRIVQMENALSVWITDCRQKKVSLDTNIIQTKAKTLYDSLVPEGGSNKDDDDGDDDDDDDPAPREKRGFVASKGWIKKFKRRFGLRSVPLYGEAASADQEAALHYVEDEFPKLIKEGGYIPEQMFNMDETGLFWKKMPSRMFFYKDEVKKPGFKAHKDRVTLLMCGNAAGLMLKPGLIYKSLNPHALKNKNKALLPVYWMSNKMAWITKALTLDWYWFVNYFIPQVKLYLTENGLPFKVLLLMDCAGGHATGLHYDGVQVEFLPPSTTSLIQPMDQGVIRAFKALYTRSTMEGLISSIDEDDDDLSLKRCWREYNIATCLANIQNALKEMKQQILNASWRKLWPDVVHDYEGFTPDEVHHSTVDKAVKLARERLVSNEGFSNMTAEDVNSLIECHLEPLTDEDLVEMTRSASEEEEEADDDDEPEQRGLTLDNLQELCNMARAMQRAQEIDDNMVRAIEFSNSIDGVMALYKSIFAQMEKQHQQLPITMFLVRRKPPAEVSDTPPAASPASYRATTLPPTVSPALSEAAIGNPPPLTTDDEASPEEQ